MSWTFDSLEWWVNAIHRSCSTMRTAAWPHKGLPRLASNELFLSELNTWYTDTLCLLSEKEFGVEQAATLLFRAKALKKWRLADSSWASRRRAKALLGFLQRNDAAASAGRIPYPYDFWMRKYLNEALPDPTRSGWEWTGRFGPGQVAERLSHPQRFEKLAEWVDASCHWPEVPPMASDCQHATARLCAVPKDALKDRLITVESAYSSFAQQYVREAMQVSVHMGRLRGTCMDLYGTDGQAIQRKLALEGSRTGTLATIDLSDASDGITWDQVRQVFPPWVLSLLDPSRSEYLSISDKQRQEIAKEAQLDPKAVPSQVRLAIFAGMGNGSTFTVETLFFSAFVFAYAMAHNLPRFVSVFGDDIVCHSETAKALMMENFAFFKINHLKSFVGQQKLREACGLFAYKGAEITCPKCDGYRHNIAGEVALCDLHRRLMDSPWTYGPRVAAHVASVGILKNWPFVAWGYPSIDDDRFQRAENPVARVNRNTQTVEVLLPCVRQKRNTYSTWASDAKRWNHPDPRVWYYAKLCGMLGRRDYEIASPSSRRRLSIDWPVKDRFEIQGKRWLHTECAITAYRKGYRGNVEDPSLLPYSAETTSHLGDPMQDAGLQNQVPTLG